MTLSIIIPVYNVEPYVGATLQSIVDQQQGLFEYEVIVVDDGTPDNSMQVVEAYKREIPEMIIVHQKNKGLSGARNTGLAHAHGRYIWFVDSDDTLAAGAFEALASAMINATPDVYGFNVAEYKNGKLQCVRDSFNKEKHHEFIDKIVKGIDIVSIARAGVAVRYIFNRRFLQENNLNFKEGIIHEDTEFLVKVICLAETFMLKDFVIYNYIRRDHGSIMSSLNMKTVQSFCAILDSWDSFSVQFSEKDIRRRIIANKCFGLVRQLLSLQKLIHSTEYIDFYKKNRWTYTIRGINYYIHGTRRFVVKRLMLLLIFVVYPKWRGKSQMH